jgi:hypothetical protein
MIDEEMKKEQETDCEGKEEHHHVGVERLARTGSLRPCHKRWQDDYQPEA